MGDVGRLEGQRCLITGGSRGLGRAMAEAFTRAGATVAFTYSRSDDDAEEARAAVSAAGREPRVFKGSVSDSAHVDQVLRTLQEEWGGLDVLVNNAGANQIMPIALIDEDDWDRVFEVNVKGAWLFSRAALKSMIRARSGCILNIGSFASERVVESPIHYAASKSALRGMTEAMAREVGRYGIRVNLLAPGLLDVGLSKILPRHRMNEYLDQCPAGRVATVGEIAETAAWLVSPENSFMSAAKIVADGGL